MLKQINEKLREIEQTHHVRILHAVESGSRAWGFPSPDSDYDVRFIYVHPLEHYLKLEDTRDVIELPINEVLDINGWDLRKALQLLYRTNPTFFEWMASPIVYRESDFAAAVRPLLPRYFSPAKGLRHYLRMAERNYRVYLSSDEVRAKKYFYVLRPVLACRWILEKSTPPPFLFSELVESQLAPDMQPLVRHLLHLKMNRPEVELIASIHELNRYLETSLAEINAQLPARDMPDCGNWQPLEQLFRQIVLAN